MRAKSTAIFLALLLAMVVQALAALPAAADSATVFLIGGVEDVLADDARAQVFVSAGPGRDSIAVFGFDGSLVTTITGQGGPTSMALNGSTLYVAEFDANRIGIFNAATRQKTGIIDTSPYLRPHSIAIAGGRLWFSYYQNGQFGGGVGSVALDGQGPISVWNLDDGPGQIYQPKIALDPGNPNTLIAWENGISPASVYRLDISTDTATQQAKRHVESGDSDFAIGPAGRFWIADGYSRFIREFNVSDLTDTGTTYPVRAAVNNVEVLGGVMAAGCTVCPSSPLIDVFDVGTTSARLQFSFSDADLFARSLEFSADGSKLFAVTSTRGGHQAFRVLEGPSLLASTVSISAPLLSNGNVLLSGNLSLAGGGSTTSKTIHIMRSLGSAAPVDTGQVLTDSSGHFGASDTPPPGDYRYFARWGGDSINRPADSPGVAVNVEGAGNRTALLVDSQPGDPTGNGRQETIVNTYMAGWTDYLGEINITGSSSPTAWQARVRPPTGGSLVPGTYTSAKLPTPSAPGLEVHQSGNPCSTPVSALEILEVAFGPDSDLERFAAKFEQHCDGSSAAFFGEIRWRSTVDYRAGVAAPRILTYPGQLIGTASAAQTTRIANTGTQSLILESASLSGGNAADFTITSDSCSNQTLAPEASCTVGIRFSPAGTSVGTRSARLTLPDNTHRGTRDIELSGTAAAPDAVVTPPANLTNPVVVSFPSPAHAVSSGNISLRLQESGSGIGGTLVCRNGSSVVSCAAGPVLTATLTPSSPLIPGQYYIGWLNPPGASPALDSSNVPFTSSYADFRGSQIEQETSPRASYQWRTVANSAAYGGSYTTEYLAGASAAHTFTGTSVTWYTRKGRDQGIAAVYIDGVSRGTFNLYSSSTLWRVPITFSGLASRTHTIVIYARGLKGSSAGTGAYVSIDALKVGTSIKYTPALAYKWQSLSASSAFGGRYFRSALGGSSAYFTFRGTYFALLTYVGPNMGKASVYVDGRLIDTLDLYQSTYRTAAAEFDGPDGLHTVRVIVLGQRNTRSTGNHVIVDGWVVD